MKPIIGVANLTAMQIQMTATGTVRTDMSIPNLLSASLFSRQVKLIEEQHKGKDFGEFWEEILANATASIFLSVAGLESYINEVFLDREKNFSDTDNELVEFFKRKEKSWSLIEKFELALAIKKSKKLEKDKNPTQNVRTLIDLRNALVHFKPEWESELVAHEKVSKSLEGKFQISPFLNERAFPRAWATHGCTSWAIKSVIEFLEQFESESGIPPKIPQFADRLRNY